MKKRISIVCPCYNEEENINILYNQIVKVMNDKLPQVEYEILFIDNYSEDGTRKIIRDLCEKDNNVRAIFNARNFGPVRSPHYALTQATGDAVILMATDLQDPPEMIADFVNKWIDGNKIVIGIKNKSQESFIMYKIRSLYYKTIKKISNIEHIEHFTGFGLYDKKFIDVLRKIDDPYPYFRGLIAELGFKYDNVYYTQPRRERGITKNNFFSLYDFAMLGITSYSKVPLRIVEMLGFIMSTISLIVAIVYFILKLIFWNSFPMGIAPITIGTFFLGSIQIFSIGLLGEYILNINTRTLRRPLVVEEERINFDKQEQNDIHPRKIVIEKEVDIQDRDRNEVV
jgi:glycosyltransferase involved in cell wall biosynthesis